jgi:cellulose synthase/poly-beta-1,6-N-acetylglucosamine synthase-like glycosyltransferase
MMSAGHPVVAGIFWACVALCIYTYAGYPLLLLVGYSFIQLRRDLRYLLGRRERRVGAADYLPSVTVVIAAYNEEDCIAAKLRNLEQTDYPIEKLQFLVVSDGSSDGTNTILRGSSIPNLECVLLDERQGKPNALNVGIARVKGEVLVLSDAATLFEPDAVRNLVRHFADETVGAVCGALNFENTSESKGTEGVYWRYESMLRLMEARWGATLTASGAIYALRKSCFRELPPGTMIEDFLIPMTARSLGFRILYDPEVIGTDQAASTVAGEFTRRVRLAVGSFRALGQLLRMRLDLTTAFAFVSHKVLRWVLPFIMIGALISNLFLLESPGYRVLLGLQIAFYAWGILGYLFRESLRSIRFALFGYFLLAMNAAFFLGFFRALAGRGGVTWRRVS